MLGLMPDLFRGILVRKTNNLSRLTKSVKAARAALVAVSVACVAFMLPTTAVAQQGSAGALLEEIVAIDTSGEPYAATFVLDRGDDMLNAARDQAKASAARVMRQLRRST